MKLKQHPAFPEIWVTPDGRVFAELLASPDASYGYHTVRHGRVRKRRHQLVCETYHGPAPTGLRVLHRDGDPGNDTATNLRWGTQKENGADMIRHGRSTRGGQNRHAKLTEAEALEIKTRRAAGESGSLLAREFAVSHNTVCDIHAERTWAWLRIPVRRRVL